MKKKKALRKDFYMEIAKTYNRFLSIFLIAALGVAFFSGIRAAEPDMRLSADKLYDETDFFDIRVLSTMGLTEDDARAIRDVEGVKEVMTSYSIDVLEESENAQYVLKVLSLPDTLNRISLTDGRMPETETECLIDARLLDHGNFQVGDTISMISGTEEKLTDSLKQTEYKVVGVCTSPYYLSLERETTSIGSGTVNGFVMIPKENFVMSAYTELYVTGKETKQLVSHTDAYEKEVSKLADAIESISKERIEIRYETIQKEAEDHLKEAEEKLEKEKKRAKKELSDAKKELEKAQDKLEEKGKEIEEAKEALEKAEKELEEKENEIKQTETDLAEKQKEWETNKKEFISQKSALETTEEQLLTQKAQLEEAKKTETDETKVAELEEQLIPVNTGLSQVAEGKRNLAKTEHLLNQAEQELTSGWEQIEQGKLQIEEGRQQLEETKEELQDGEQKRKEGQEELAKNWKEYENAKVEAESKLAEGEGEIEEGRQTLNELEHPKWYVLDRNSIQTYVEYGQNAKRIGAIGEVFPVIFFLVAALVCLTTMKRMVEEERTQIGTLKALGYKNMEIAAKYLLYAGLASVGGGIAGTLIGQKILPYVIITAYKILYNNLSEIVIPVHFYYSLTSIVAVAVCTILTTFFACHKELKAQAAELMRPEAPKAGKRVILERITFLWKHLSFTMKASVRNLLRYKKRFFMTVFGIAGCMALLLVAFGLRDSIYKIGEKQFGDIIRYDSSIKLKEKAAASEIQELREFLIKNPEVDIMMPVYSNSVKIKSKEIEKDATLIVPSETDDLEQFVSLKNRISRKSYDLKDMENGIVISEKAANLMNVKAGDTILLQKGEGEFLEVTVEGVMENYIFHYVYMSPELFAKLFGEKAVPNLLYLKEKDSSDKAEQKLAEEVLQQDAVIEISFIKNQSDSIYNMLGSLNIVIYVLIISAGLLAFVVLYNLNNININERRRELATIKVLGFYNNEMAKYVYRENIMLTLIGIIVGIFFGMILHRYVILTAELDILMFGRKIGFLSYVWSVLLTIFFSAFVNFAMYFKLKKIDMVESLKSVE